MPMYRWIGLKPKPLYCGCQADIEGLVKYLVEEKNFSEERVRRTGNKINASRGKSTQGRLESFFGPVTTTSSAKKRKIDPKETKGKGAKKGKLGGFGKKK